MNFTISHLQSLQKQGKIKGFKSIGGSSAGNKNDISNIRHNAKSEPKGLIHIKKVLEANGIEYATEYQFAKPRKFRFDIAIPEIMVAVEYEGLMSKKSRHTTIKGYTNDCSKYNLSSILGWKTLRYTILNVNNFEHDLKQFYERQKQTKGERA